jgi:endonuclease/exonuclease/phosphatase family metal-dependent hydrolase
MNARESPTIWPAYTQYLNSGQRYRIPFDEALSAWNTDVQRWAYRNAQIPTRSARSARSARAIRVTSWNVHQWRRADGTPAGADQLAADLATIDADVLCLQEYAPTEALAERYPYSVVEMLYDHGGGFGNAIFSKYPITQQRVIELPTTPPVLERRVCMHAQIAVPGETLHVFNTHLEVRNDYPDVHRYRYPQLHRIIEAMNATPGRVILCGDFNTGWNSEVDRQLHRELTAAGYRNAGAYARQAQHVHTNMVRNTSLYGGFVDHIYVRAKRAKRAERIVGFYELFTNASDHYPVIVDIDAYAHTSKLVS